MFPFAPVDRLRVICVEKKGPVLGIRDRGQGDMEIRQKEFVLWLFVIPGSSVVPDIASHEEFPGRN